MRGARRRHAPRDMDARRRRIADIQINERRRPRGDRRPAGFTGSLRPEQPRRRNRHRGLEVAATNGQPRPLGGEPDRVPVGQALRIDRRQHTFSLGKLAPPEQAPRQRHARGVFARALLQSFRGRNGRRQQGLGLVQARTFRRRHARQDRDLQAGPARPRCARPWSSPRRALLPPREPGRASEAIPPGRSRPRAA